MIRNLSIAGINEKSKLNMETSESHENWIRVWYQYVVNHLPDIDYSYWLGWLLAPVALAFLLPVFLLILIYISSFIVFAYRQGLFRRLREAATERDVLKAAREVIAFMWMAFGSMWYGYEVHGWENIPDEGPALIVYYHGAVPVDYYQLVVHCLLK